MALAPRALLPPLAPSLTPTASQSRRLAWVAPGRCGCRRVCPRWQCGSSRHVRRWTPVSGHQHRAWWRCFGAQKHVHEREQAGSSLNLTFEFEINISSYRYHLLGIILCPRQLGTHVCMRAVNDNVMHRCARLYMCLLSWSPCARTCQAAARCYPLPISQISSS